MEPTRKFILKAGSKLSCISYRNSINNPIQHFYFTSSAEALLSLFRSEDAPFPELSLDQVGHDIGDIYLNVFMLNEDLIIYFREYSQLQGIINQATNLEDVSSAIRGDCQQNTSDQNGYVIQYIPTVFEIKGRLSAYVICKPDVLIHVSSYRIRATDLKYIISNQIRIWNEEVNTSNRKPITFAVIFTQLLEIIKGGNTPFLDQVFIQPTVPGYATSPIKTPNQTLSPTSSSLTSSYVSPSSTFSSSFSSPQRLSPQQISPMYIPAPILSPGGTTGVDAFENVPSDIVRVMALNMTLSDIGKLCGTSRKFYNEICDSNEFWYRKCLKEFPTKVKPEGTQWKVFYADLIGEVENQLGSDLLDLKYEQIVELVNLAPELRGPRVREMRRIAGLGPRRGLNFGGAEAQPQQNPNAFFQMQPINPINNNAIAQNGQLPVIHGENFIYLGGNIIQGLAQGQPMLGMPPQENPNVVEDNERLDAGNIWRDFNYLLDEAQMAQRYRLENAENEVFGNIVRLTNQTGDTPENELEAWINLLNANPAVGILRDGEEQWIRGRLNAYLNRQPQPLNVNNNNNQ